MSDTEENPAEVRQVTRHKMSDMEEKAEDMTLEMKRKTRCTKVEIKEVKAEVD